MAKPLQIAWAAVVLFGLGSGFGTHLHRLIRLPSWFWLPCVSGTAGLLAYALFYVSFVSPNAGRLASVLCWGTSVVLFAAALRDPAVRRTLRQRDAWLPALLTALLTTSYLASAIASDAPVDHRFRFPLPPDNVLPQMFADRIAAGTYGLGVTPPPLDADWRSSDRPPLQAALVLATRPLRAGHADWFSQFAATICQMGWVAAFYALGRTVALPRRYLQFVLAAAATSPFFFFNSLYTWPKLLSAWLFVTALAMMAQLARERPGEPRVHDEHDELGARHAPPTATSDVMAARVSEWTPVVAAGATALALLSHGGVAFSLLAWPLLAAWWKRWRFVPPRVWLAAIAVVVLLIGPWMAYQQFYDPPGNRLLKVHLAGVEAVDARATAPAIADTYRTLTWSGYLTGRRANLTQQWFGTYPLPVESPIDWVQWQQLLHHVPLIGFLSVGYFVLLWSPPRAGLPDASLRLIQQLTWYALGTAAVWIALMIVPSSTLVHQGSYVMTALLLFCAASLTAMLPPAARWTLLALHVLLFATCYLFSTRTAMPTPVAWRPLTFVESAAALAAFFLVLRAVPDAEAPAPISELDGHADRRSPEVDGRQR